MGSSSQRWNFRYGHLSPDNKTLATGSADRTVKLWDIRTLREIGALEGHSGVVRSVAFSPDGKRLVSGSEDHLAPAAKNSSIECG